LQEQSDSALQAVQSGGLGEGVSDDFVSASGAQDDQTMVHVSMSQVQQ